MPSQSHTERFVLDLVRQTNLECVWRSLLAWLADHGFDRVLYAATRFRTAHGTGDLRDAVILTNYPKEFTEPYLEGGLFRDSPMVRWAMDNVGSRSWTAFARDAAEGRFPPEVLRVMHFNRLHGVVAGYGISFPRISGRSGHGIGLGSTRMSQAEVDHLWLDHGAEIELVAHVAHLTMLSLPHDLHGRSLTKRQREVLEHVANGKTVQDVAILIGRNATTVEKHLRLARDALDVETTAQAILKIAVQNQFFLFQGEGA